MTNNDEGQQTANISVTFNCPSHSLNASQRRRRSFGPLVGIARVLVVLCMAGVAGSATSSPEATALLQAKGCGSCHVIPGVEGAYGTAGPSLKGLNERQRIVGGILKNSPENMKAWLKNPKSMKSGTMMPNTGLIDKEVEILIQYFDTI